MKRIIFILPFLLLNSCTYLAKMYEFEPATFDSEHGSIKVEVTGTWNENDPDISEYSTPYRVSIRFESEDLPGEPIEIRLLSLNPEIEEFKKYKINEKGETDKHFSLDENDPMNSDYFVSISEIDFYGTITIKFKLIYKGTEEKFEAVLNTNYWEERRNKFGDAIMSVQNSNKALERNFEPLRDSKSLS